MSHSSPPRVRSRWGVSYANEAAMDLQRDAPWDILSRERFLNSSRATRKRNRGGGAAGPKNGTEAFI